MTEGLEGDRYETSLGAVYRLALKLARGPAAYKPVMCMLMACSVSLVLWEGGHLVQEGILSAGSLFACLLYTVTITTAMRGLSGVYGQIREAVGSSVEIFSLVDQLAEAEGIAAHQIGVLTPGSVGLENCASRTSVSSTAHCSRKLKVRTISNIITGGCPPSTGSALRCSRARWWRASALRVEVRARWRHSSLASASLLPGASCLGSRPRRLPAARFAPPRLQCAVGDAAFRGQPAREPEVRRA